MMRILIFSLFILNWNMQSRAQWRWYLQAEIGANKQEILSTYQLAQQPFDPQAFWKATSGGELQFGYTLLKVISAYTGLGYTHQNMAYQSTEWATDNTGTSFLLLCDKTAKGELLTIPLGLELKALGFHVGGGMQYRYRIQGTMQTDFYAFAPGAPSANLISSEIGPNTQSKLDMGYFAYLQWNPITRLGIRASAYRGYRDLSNGLEVGAFNEWQQLFDQESFTIKNLQFNLGINIRLSE